MWALGCRRTSGGVGGGACQELVRGTCRYFLQAFLHARAPTLRLLCLGSAAATLLSWMASKQVTLMTPCSSNRALMDGL
eukprot:CAMPEP_0194494058 /NCGR_PEP_ID=MMETSP0253-20130528/12085_1 /TAXON_ID=2966 /ORGANISM="Noctiluca scintillans" /LENGTH=78 /DNA_ID=CAMNT_0039335119 /DNA_START=658 /DNA_END=894 /DNA_ORIENTATION=-